VRLFRRRKKPEQVVDEVAAPVRKPRGYVYTHGINAMREYRRIMEEEKK